MENSLMDLALNIMEVRWKEGHVTTESNGRMLWNSRENQQSQDVKGSPLPGLFLHPVVEQH